MANNKTGFPFYAADTDRFQDLRIKRLKKDMGCDGFAVYEYILNEIYRVKGCLGIEGNKGRGDSTLLLCCGAL